MSFIADAHREWHTVNGQYNSECPLDCGAMSPEQREAEAQWEWESYLEEFPIRCGHCKGRHETVAGVKACSGKKVEAPVYF